jgi:hypothetical protein
MDYKKQLIDEAKKYAKRHKYSLSYISYFLVSHSDLFTNLAKEGGKGCHIETYQKAMDMFRKDIPIKELRRDK